MVKLFYKLVVVVVVVVVEVVVTRVKDVPSVKYDQICKKCDNR